jgi:hypothetical protein
MKTEAIYKLVGFDRQTELEAVAYDIPWHLVREVMKIAHVDMVNDPLVGALELHPARAREIAAMLHREIDPGSMDFFLESFAAPVPSYGLHARV